jgi:hypothetical protein
MWERTNNAVKPPVPATSQYIPAMSSRPSTVVPSNSTSGASFVPPHLRGIGGSAAGSSSNIAPASGSASSLSNPFGSGVQSKDNGSAGGWTPVDARRRAAAGVSYNAWDSQGNQHVQHRVPSGSVSGSTVSASSAATVIAAASAVRAPSPPARKNSNWAKPVSVILCAE